MNRVILIGRLVRDPEVRTLSSGQTMALFVLAVDRGVANLRGEREVDFIDIVAWRALAEQVGAHLRRGRLVGVEGRLHVRRYETAEGERRKAAQVVADRVRFLDRKLSQTKPAQEGTAADEPAPEEVGPMCPSECEGYRVMRTWVVPAWAIAQVRSSPSRLLAVAGDFDRKSDAVEDWMIAVWLSVREEGFHDTTAAEPLGRLAGVVH